MKKALSLILALVMCLSLCACGNSKANEMPNDQATTVATIPAEDIWKIVEMTDDFGDPTGEYYVQSILEGTFSNTSTTDEQLKVVVFHNCKRISGEYDIDWAFQLFEYGDNKATYTSSDSKVLKIKVDGEVHEIDLYGDKPNGDLIILCKDYKFTNILSPALVEGKDVPCVIQIGNSTYRFTIKAESYWDTVKKGMELTDEK